MWYALLQCRHLSSWRNLLLPQRLGSLPCPLQASAAVEDLQKNLQEEQIIVEEKKAKTQARRGPGLGHAH